jgi:hypothetical protein
MFHVVFYLTGTAGATGVAIDSALGSLSEKVSEYSYFLYRSYQILFLDFTSTYEESGSLYSVICVDVWRCFHDII